MKKVLFVLTLICTALCASAHDRGYRGEVGVDYTVGNGYIKINRGGINTTHGYQINPYLFVGGGIAVRFMSEYDDYPYVYRAAKTSIPVYGDIRCNFTKSKIVPFVDLKVGHFLTNEDTFYGILSAGLLFKIRDNQGISISVGTTSDTIMMEEMGYSSGYKYTSFYIHDVLEDCSGISFQVAYEF